MNLSQCNRAQGTIKQRAFVRYLFDVNNPQTFGNGTQAARKAHYKGSNGVLANVAWENVRKPQVVKMAEDIVHNILSTDEVEQEITKIAKHQTPVDGTMKMKALDLLTKIKAMQIQKVESSSTVTTIDPSHLLRSIHKLSSKTGQNPRSIALEFQRDFSDQSDLDYNPELEAAITQIVDNMPVTETVSEIEQVSDSEQ